MTATTSVRTTAKAALIDALQSQNALANVPVSPGWPGRSLQREHVWVATIRGDVNYPLLMAGRKHRDDQFVITIIFQSATPGFTPEQADSRVEEMYAALEDVLADDQTLGSLDGVLAAVLGPTVEGPDAELTDEGAVSFIRADVSIHARLT